MRSTVLAVAIITCGCTPTTASNGGGEAGAGADAGDAAAALAARTCSVSLATACATDPGLAGLLAGRCVASFDEALLCSTWGHSGSNAIVRECAGFHVVHLWNVEPHSVYFYSLSDGKLLAFGYTTLTNHPSTDGVLICSGGPDGLVLPQECANPLNAEPCQASDATAPDAATTD